MATGLALLSIDTEEGVPSTSLGPRMGMESTSLSRTLKSMENQGLIRREPNPEDGRGVLIRLTEEGLEKRSLSREVVMQFNQAIEESVSPDELESFYKVIALILQKVQEKSILFPKNKCHEYKKNIKSGSYWIWNHGFWYCLSFCKYWSRSLTSRYRTKRIN